MSIRSLIAEKQGLVTICVLVGLIVAIVLIVMQTMGGPAYSSESWFYDTETGELFADSFGSPPVDAPSGAGNGVVAYVLECDGTKHIYWLMNKETDDQGNQIELAAIPSDNLEWYPRQSTEASLAMGKRYKEISDECGTKPESSTP